MNVNKIIGRDAVMFAADVARHEPALLDALKGARILLLGGAGSIGKEVAAQVFARAPAALHVVDISENNLVELVRDLRSTQGYLDGETRFLPIDMGSLEFEAFVASQKPYDYVLNLAAMKHVRSEKDAFSLMRMIKTNVLDSERTLALARGWRCKKYFAVSTDKAKNPANLMGSTKRVMELVLFASAAQSKVSTARFANVAFSDGSLLHGFRQRLLLKQPLSAPRDVRRYFLTGPESGLLCLCSLVLGEHREIFFPRLDPGAALQTFSSIAVRFLEENGYEALPVASEEEARHRAAELGGSRKWPCYFFDSDTSGEKMAEEFYSEEDDVDWGRFAEIGVIRAPELSAAEIERVETFLMAVGKLRSRGFWSREELIRLIADACPELSHVETGRFLDDRM